MATRSREFWSDHGLLIGGSVVLWAIVLAGGWLGYRLCQPAPGSLLPRRDPPRACRGRGGPWDGGACRAGAVLANARGQVERRVSFGKPGFGECLDQMEPVTGPEGELVGYLNRGSWACPTAWLDTEGRVLWRYRDSSGTDDTAVGDLDGDGRLDFVVGFNAGGGVHRVDDGGRRVWSQPDGNVWRVALLDTDRDGRLEIIHSNAAGQLTIRDQTGRVIRQTKPASSYFSHFSLVQWPGRDDPALLQMEDERIWVFDAAGATVATRVAPRATRTFDAFGTRVRGKADQAELFAVVGTYAPWKRSALYVYSPDGALLYQEILADVCAGIAALPALDGRSESLLVGCDGVVWRYDLPG
jgi:hypothetical protein